MRKSIILFISYIMLLAGCQAPEELKVREFDDDQIQANNSNSKPYINFQSFNAVYDESIGTIKLTVTIDKLPSGYTILPFTVSGTAVNGADYTYSPFILAFDPVAMQTDLNEYKKEITINIIDDAIREPLENISVALQPPSTGDVLLGTQSLVNIQIYDNDAFPVVNFVGNYTSIDEDDPVGTVDIDVSLSTPTDQDVTVNYKVTGSASSATDYSGISAPTGSFIIPGNQNSYTLSVNINNDGFNELEENLIITMQSVSSNALLGGGLQYTIKIKDDESEPTITFIPQSLDANPPFAIVSETNTVNTFTVQVSGNLENSIKVPLYFGGSAVAGVDYTNPPLEITLPGGSNPIQTFTLSLIDDYAYEGEETIIITLGNNNFIKPVAPDNQFILRIADNESMPEATFSTQTSFQYEPSNESTNTFVRQVNLNVSLNKPSNLPTTVGYTLSPLSTSTQAKDHNLNSTGEIVIPAGSVSGVISFQIGHDDIYEYNETVIIDLTSCTNCDVGLMPFIRHTVTIYDNDTPPIVKFSNNSQRISETVGATVGADVQIELSEVSERDTVVFFNYYGGSAKLEDCDPSGMSTPDPAENVWNGIYNSTPLNDGDACHIPSFDNPATATVEGIENQTNWDSSSPATWFITIPAGQKQAHLIWPLKKDGLDEPDENLTITLGTPVNGTLLTNTTHSIIISDDDALPSVSFLTSASDTTVPAPPSSSWSNLVSEGNNNETNTMSIGVQLSGPSSQEIVVPIKSILGNAVVDKDYKLPVEWDPNVPSTWVVIFPPGETTQFIDITVLGDEVFELNETIIIELGNVSNATKSLPFVHTMTIIEDDLAPLVEFAVGAQSVLESSGFVEVEVKLVPAGVGEAQVLDKDIQVPIELANTALRTYKYKGVCYFGLGGELDEATCLGNAGTWYAPDNTPNPGNMFGMLGFPVATGGSGGDYLIPQAWTLDPENPWMITIPAGQTSGKVVLTILNDAHYEEAEFIDLQLYFIDTAPIPPPGDEDIFPTFMVNTRIEGTSFPLASTGNDLHEITIIDEDPKPTVRFSTASSTRNEGDGSTTTNNYHYIEMKLSAKSYESVGVEFAISGTSTVLLDYDIDDSKNCANFDPAALADWTLAPGSPMLEPVLDDTSSFAAEGVIYDDTLGPPDTYRVNFPDGATRACIVVEIIDDAGAEVFEAQEYVQFNITNVYNGVISPILNQHKLFITDNELPPKVEFAFVEKLVYENELNGGGPPPVPYNPGAGPNTTVAIEVKLDGIISELPTYVQLGAVQGSANRGDINVVNVDYAFPSTWNENVPSSWEIEIPAGATSASVNFTINNEAVHEPEENIQMDIVKVVNGTAGYNSRMNVKILPNDDPPEVDFQFFTHIMSENQSYKAVTVQLSEVSGYDIEIPIQLLNTAAVDYGTGVDKVRIIADNAGPIADGIPLTFADNTTQLGNVISNWNLFNPTNSVDAPFNVGTETPNQNAPGPFASNTVYLSRAEENQDFIVVQKKITIPAGMQLGVVNVNVLNDTSYELNENILMEFAPSMNLSRVLPGFGIQQTMVTIMEDDAPPQVSFTTNAQIVDEPLIGKKKVTATISLDTISFRDVQVDIISLTGSAKSDQYDPGACSLAGAATDTRADCEAALEYWYNLTNDFDHPSDIPGWVPDDKSTWKVTIPAGFTSVDLNFYINYDDYYEIDEQFSIQIGNVSNAVIGVHPIHTINIKDVSGVPQVSFESVNSVAVEDVADPLSTVNLNIVSSKPTEYEMKVPIKEIVGSGQYPATLGADFTYPPGWTDYNHATKWYVTFAPGEITQPLSFQIVDDNLVEYTEGISVRLDIPIINGNVNGYLGQISQHTINILPDAANDGDDDIRINFSQVQFGALESKEFIEVTLTLSSPTINDVYVTLSLVDGFDPASCDGGDMQAAIEAANVICPLVDPDVEAIQYEDHNFFQNTYIIPAGETFATVNIPIFDEDDHEKNEFLFLKMTNPVNASFDPVIANSITTAALTIYNDDAYPYVEFRLAEDKAIEYPGLNTVYNLEFVKSADSYLPITVTMGAVTHIGKHLCEFAGGNPTDSESLCTGFGGIVDRDYRLDTGDGWTVDGGGTITLIPGQMDITKTIDIFGTNGRYFEIDEQVIFTISSIANGIPGSVFQHTMTIEDQDTPPELNFTTVSQLVNEPNTPVRSTAVGFATLSQFHLANPANPNFNFPLAQDPLDDLTYPLFPDPDPVQDDGTISIKVSLSSPSEYAVRVPIQDITGNADLAKDYTLQSGWTASFPDSWIFDINHSVASPAANTYGLFTVTINDDRIYETIENINFVMGQPFIFDFGNEYLLDVGSNETAIVNIISLDPQPRARFVNYNLGTDGNPETYEGCLIEPCASGLNGEYKSTQTVSEFAEVNFETAAYVDFELDRPSYQASDIVFVIDTVNDDKAPYTMATPLADYKDLDYNFSVTLPPGEVVGSFEFKIIDDIVTEETQSVKLKILPSGQTQVADPTKMDANVGGGANTHVLNIQDDDIIQLALGENHSCALISDRVKCWGYNGYGNLGTGSTSAQPDASQAQWVNLGTHTNGDPLYVVTLVAGARHTCALIEQTKQIKCWGDNAFGQAGQANSTDYTKLSKIGDQFGEMGANLPYVNFGSNWEVLDVVAGYVHTCAFLRHKTTSANKLKCFGQNTYGQLGLDDKDTIGTEPNHWGENLPAATDFLSGSTYVNQTNQYDTVLIDKIFAGGYNTCIVTKPLSKIGNKSVHFCWGNNFYHQAGNDRLMKAFQGKDVDANDDTFAIEMDGFYTGMFDYYPDETVYMAHDDNFDLTKSWGPIGWGRYGQYWTHINPVGYFPIPNQRQDIRAIGDEPGEMTRFTATGLSHAFDKEIIDMKFGANHICAVFTDDTACWGGAQNILDSSGGTNTYKSYTYPGLIGKAYDFNLGTRWNQVQGVDAVSLKSRWDAMSPNATSGFVNVGHPVLLQDLWEDVPYAISQFGSSQSIIDVSTGSNFTCVLFANGTVKCNGDNRSFAGTAFGTLGINSNSSLGPDSTFNPASNIVASLTNAKRIWSSTAHSCAVRDSNQVQCWGKNQYGQAGAGASSPTYNDGNFGIGSLTRPISGNSKVINFLESGTAKLCDTAAPVAPRSNYPIGGGCFIPPP